MAERSGIPAGTEIGGYEILAPLGTGGMGTVYRAADGAGNQVALKLLHPSLTLDPQARQRLEREVQALHRLRHPAVARVLDAETEGLEAFVVTDLIDGQNLEEYVAAHGPLDATQLARLSRPLYDALAYVHSVGVLHRDLKPSNVMVTESGPVLIDFGIAHSEGASRLTSTGLVMGTPGYVSPEVLAGGEPDVAADWWGFAAVLAFAATGRPPFGASPLEAVLGRVAAGDPDLNGLPARTSLAFASALRATTSDRTTPVELVDELEGIAQSGNATVALESVRHTGPQRTRTIAAPGTTAVQPLGAAPRRPADAEATTTLPAEDATAALGTGATSVMTAGATVAPGATSVMEAHPSTGAGATSVMDARPQLQPQPQLPGPLAHQSWQPQGQPVADPNAPYVPQPPATPTAKSRWGTVLAIGVVVTALAAIAPGIALIAAVVLTILARTWGFGVGESIVAQQKGTRLPTWKAVLLAPWNFLRSVVTLVPGVVVALSIIAIVGGIGLWALQTERIDWATRYGPWAYSALMAVCVGLGITALWFGPFSRLHRFGARWSLATLAPGRAGALIVWGIVLIAAVTVVVLVRQGQVITWWPLPAMPDLT